MSEVQGVDRDALLAERAEAEAQLRAAEATLGTVGASTNGHGHHSEQEQREPVQKPQRVEKDQAPESAPFDAAELRRAAAAARAADDVLARASAEAAPRPMPDEDQLGQAESAFVKALEVREDLPAAWRRLVGALISATGMAIVIGALGWNVYWLLVPISLIAIMTVDLRVAGQAAREASAAAASELASVGVAGTDGLDLIRFERTRIEEAEERLAVARGERDAAFAHFEKLAPGRAPADVEDVIAVLEAHWAATVRSQPEPEPEPLPVPDSEPVADAPLPEVPAAAADWWFGDKAPAAPEALRPVEPASPAPPVTPAPSPAPTPAAVPAPAPAPVRALAERLSAEGREALARIEAQLAALERVELAKRSLEWHEQHSTGETPATG